MKNKKTIRISRITRGLVAVSAMLFLFGLGQSAQALDRAGILSPKPNASVLDQPLQVIGFAPVKSTVFVFLDGKLVGGTNVKPAKSKKDKTSSFIFTYKGKRIKAGSHTLETKVVKGKEGSSYTKQTFKVPVTTARKVDGQTVKTEVWNQLPLGIMIENTPSARPQAGLSEAAVVYETLAEGAVTRFLAIFPQATKPKQVGPIRSTRPYYVDWAKEYDAVLIHAGGSRDAFNEVGNLRVRSYDTLTKRAYAYTFRVCYGEHCLFTDKTRLEKLVAANKLDTYNASSTGWKFKNDTALKNRPNTLKKLTIDFNGRTYKVEWRYNRATNKYLRWNGGYIAKDRNTNKQLTASNVIFMRIPKEKVLDRKGHLGLQLTGTGDAILYRDGQAIPLRWVKPNTSSRTIFYQKSNNKEVEFNRGTTWVEVVPGNRTVLYQ
jgi:hypothetical protein